VTANKKGEKSVILRTNGSEKSRITVMISDSELNGNAITSRGNGVFLVMAYSY